MITTNTPLLATDLPWPCRRGKVRDVYDLGQHLLIVSTDRISAFDWVLPCGIPDKGRVLSQMSVFWFQKLAVENHLLTSSINDLPDLPVSMRESLEGRCMLARKAQVIPFECVVRGYLEGSGWKEYRENQSVCSVRLPPGLVQCDKLPEPIFTPATKSESGHDENVSFEFMASAIGSDIANELKSKSIAVYEQGKRWAENRGILIADTKLEWGLFDNRLILIDEVLTPDSSRFWPADDYRPGMAQPSYDKQFVRQWLLASNWDRQSPPPVLPADVIARTREKYVEAFEILTDQPFPWK